MPTEEENQDGEVEMKNFEEIEPSMVLEGEE